MSSLQCNQSVFRCSMAIYERQIHLYNKTNNLIPTMESRFTYTSRKGWKNAHSSKLPWPNQQNSTDDADTTKKQATVIFVILNTHSHIHSLLLFASAKNRNESSFASEIRNFYLRWTFTSFELVAIHTCAVYIFWHIQYFIDFKP